MSSGGSHHKSFSRFKNTRKITLLCRKGKCSSRFLLLSELNQRGSFLKELSGKGKRSAMAKMLHCVIDDSRHCCGFWMLWQHLASEVLEWPRASQQRILIPPDRTWRGNSSSDRWHHRRHGWWCVPSWWYEPLREDRAKPLQTFLVLKDMGKMVKCWCSPRLALFCRRGMERNGDRYTGHKSRLPNRLKRLKRA